MATRQNYTVIRSVIIDGLLQRSKEKIPQFHLRAFVIASGALDVFLYTRFLALFAPLPWQPPHSDLRTDKMAAHLTNTVMESQEGRTRASVRILDELVGCHVLGHDASPTVLFTADDILDITHQMQSILSSCSGQPCSLSRKPNLVLSNHHSPSASHYQTPLSCMRLTFCFPTLHIYRHRLHSIVSTRCRYWISTRNELQK